MVAHSDVWNSGEVLRAGDPCDRYLKCRGIHLVRFPECLRFVSELPSWRKDIDSAGSVRWVDEGSFPALVARIDSPSGEMITLHRTYLTPDGQKATVESPKKLMKSPFPGATKGCAMRLCSIETVVALAEGLETALAYHVLTGIPAWATITAGGMESVVLPPQVETVYICIDVDHSGRGREAANKLKGRLLDEGRKVLMATPPGATEGVKSFDWLDYLNELQNEFTRNPDRPFAS